MKLNGSERLLNGTRRLRLEHFKILAGPFVITCVVLCVWMWLHLHGYYQSKNDSDETTNSLLPLLGAFHAIVAGFLLIRVLEEDGKVHEYVEANDVKRLRRELRKRIHPLVHILLAVFTTLIVGATMFLPYDSVWSGIEHVGGTTFALSLYWIVAIALDNSFTTPWVRDVIPLRMQHELERLAEEEHQVPETEGEIEGLS